MGRLRGRLDRPGRRLSVTLRSTESNSSALGYVTVVSAVAIAAFCSAVVVFGFPRQLTWFWALLVLGLLAGIGRPQAIGPIQMSTYGIVQLAAIPLVGPVGTAVVAALSESYRRKEPVKRVFNMAQRVLLALAAAAVYYLLGGRQLTYGDTGIWALAGQLALAALTGALVNAGLLVGVLRLTTGGSLRVLVVDLVKQIVPAYAIYAVAAYILAILWAPAGLGWVSIFFFLPSLLVIQWGLRQLAAEWAVRHEAVAPFVTALEMRYPGSARSSRLAAEATNAMASGMGMQPAFVDQVTMAARLRDVGMLALDDNSTWVVRRDHVTSTSAMLGHVGFLTGPLGFIAGHHERVDGQGWPQGLSGDQIPLGGRILAVADTWSQAVLEGCDVEEAVLTCEDQSGQSLDGRCVDALRRAHHRGQLPAVEADT